MENYEKMRVRFLISELPVIIFWSLAVLFYIVAFMIEDKKLIKYYSVKHFTVSNKIICAIHSFSKIGDNI